MIEARHRQWSEWIFVPYIKHLFRRNFFSLNLLGEIPKCDRTYPLMVLPNHSTWWDGFFAYFLNRKIFQRTAFLMMLESQLNKFPFFSRVGAFGLDPSTLSGVRRSLRYSIKTLRDHTEQNPVLFYLFPQGELKPWRSHSLDYKRGFCSIIKHYGKNVCLLQLAIKTMYLEEQYPHVFFKFNKAEVTGKDHIEKLIVYQHKHEKLLESLEHDIQRGERGKVLFRGKQSISRKFE